MLTIRQIQVFLVDLETNQSGVAAVFAFTTRLPLLNLISGLTSGYLRWLVGAGGVIVITQVITVLQ